MSERYIKVFAGNENLYLEGAPVIILASALLKDTQTGKMLAQLKLQNISGKSISYVKISITQLDAVKNPLSKAIPFEYLDLSVSDKEEFGSKKPLPLPNSSTRSFGVGVSHVGFSDGTVWTSDNTDWQSAKQDSNIIKSLEAEKTYKAAVALSKNNSYDDVSKAKELFESIASIKDVTIEVKMCDEKLIELEENAKVHEVKAKKKKKAVKAITIPLVSVLALVLLVFSVFDIIIPATYVSKGKKLENEGRYREACEAYSQTWENAISDLFTSVFFDPYEALDRCSQKEFDQCVESGDTQELVDLVTSHLTYSHPGRLPSLDVWNAPTFDSSQSDILDGIHGAIAKLLDEETCNTVLGEYYEDRYEDATGYRNFIYYLIATLPSDYKDVEQLKEFLDASDWYTDSEDYITNNKSDVEKIWKYHYCRTIILSSMYSNIDAFLLGKWESQDGDSYLEFYYQYDSYRFTTNLVMPDVKENRFFGITDNKLEFYNSDNRWDVFQFEFSKTNANEMTVYCYEDGKTITLYRK